MAEVTQLMFTNKEVIETLLKKANITEGFWTLAVEFGFGALVAGPTPDQASPSAIISTLKVGIQKAEKNNPAAVDASLVT